MGMLNGKMKPSAKKFVEERMRQEEVKESNRRTQNAINLRAMINKGIDAPLSKRDINIVSSMECQYGEED